MTQEITSTVTGRRFEVCLEAIRTPNVASVTPTDVEASAAEVGTSTRAARADHKHEALTAAPTMGVGAGNAEGAATTLARSDHTHALRETGGPTELVSGAVRDGELFARVLGTFAGARDLALSPRVLYLDPTLGDDTAAGGVSTPLQTLRELERRRSWFGEDLRVILKAGTHKRFDYEGLALLDARMTWGGFNGLVSFEGETTVASTFTVSGASGIVISASGSPGWTTNEHRGRFVPLVAFGFTFWRPIISNTASTITVAVGSSGIGGFIPLPTSGSLQIHSLATTIAPPDVHGTSFQNKLFLSGNVALRKLIFDGGYAGPASHAADLNATIEACSFRNTTGEGLGIAGYATVSGCDFSSCAGGGVLAGAGVVGLYDCLFRSSSPAAMAFFPGAVINFGALSMQAFISCNVAAQGKTGGLINDEGVRVHLTSVQDYLHLQRGGRYQKVNAALKGIAGSLTPTRNVVRMVGGGNIADMLDTAAQDLTPTGAYFHFEGGQGDLALATYATDGRNSMDAFGNHVFDGGDP